MVLKRTLDASRRSGAVTLELILTLPVLVIAVLAIVEFGLLYSQAQIVEMAARAGAQVASRHPGLSPVSGDPVPAAVIDAVVTELNPAAIQRFRITLEHNVDATANPSGVVNPPVLLSSSSPGGPAVMVPVPAVDLSPVRRYVRVTVTVPTTELTPNLLSVFGLDFTQRVSQQVKLRRYTR